MDKAVTQSRGQVVMAGRSLAATVYSANGGGSSAATEEGFGTSGAGYPYLRPAPYPTQDTMNWTLRVALRDVGRRLGYRGTVTGVRVTSAGPSGRALQVTLDGASGPRSVAGLEFRRALGLRSTLFTTKLAVADAPPPPPPAETGPVQALPDAGSAAPLEDQAASVTVGPGPTVPLAAGPAAGADSTAPAAKLALAALAWLLLLSVVIGHFVLGRPPGRREAGPGDSV